MEISNLDKMEAAVYPAVSLKFNGKEVIQIAKRLSSLEIQSCGDFSLINLDSDKHKGSTEDPVVQMAKYAELQHKVLKMSMINPTYDEVEEMLLKHANVEDLKERMQRSKEQYIFNKDLSIEDKKILEREYAILEMRVKFIFPSDFLIDMFTFATSQDISDIKLLVSEEILYNAAILAKKGNCRPSDILCEDGNYTAFNKHDIDMRAEIIFYERTKKKK